MKQALMFIIASAIAALVAVLPAQAQEKRVALVIGNANYQNTQRLKNPGNDARDIAAALQRLNFEVITGYDLDRAGFMKTLDTFRARAEGADVALLYYAGHGLQYNGQNFLVAVDAKLDTPADLDRYTVRLTMLLDELNTPTRLVFLDACRNYPLTKASFTGELNRSTAAGALPKGLARVKSTAGTLISFATEPDAVALDGTGRNSPFTGALLQHLTTPDMDISQMLRRVTKDVRDATNKQQTPWQQGSLLEDFYFRRVALTDPASNPDQDRHAKSNERTFWQSIERSLSLEAFQTFVRRYPDSEYTDKARRMVDELKREQNTAQDTTKNPSNSALNAEQESDKKPTRIASNRDDTSLYAPNTRPQDTTALPPVVNQDVAVKSDEPAKQTPPVEPVEQNVATEREPVDTTPQTTANKPYTTDQQSTSNQTTQQEFKVASRTDDTPVPPAKTDEVPTTPVIPPEQVATELQKELKRVGCYTGALDGDWGPRSKQALKDFVQEAHLDRTMADDEPSSHLIARVRTHQNVCPPPSKPAPQVVVKQRHHEKRKVAREHKPRYHKPAPQYRPSAPAPGPLSVGVGIGGINF